MCFEHQWTPVSIVCVSESVRSCKASSYKSLERCSFTRFCVMMTLCICWKFSAVEVLAPLSNSGWAAHARVITSSRFRFPFIPARVSLSSFT